jgi:putative intracellular protease/amidase
MRLRLLVLFAAAIAGTPAFARPPAPAPAATNYIAAWQPRFGRARPLVAVVGENGSGDSTTELADYVLPLGILRASKAAEVVSLATASGPLVLRPALRIQPQATVAAFDADYPDGADYVIVPAVSHPRDPALLAWLASQGAKGATLVSICDGALVVANTGLMDGHRATAHWDTQALRAKVYPQVAWMRNIRYVADGRIVSSAGISAAMPVALALVEAIAGTPRAAAVARTLGVADWSDAHDSDRFLPQWGNLRALLATNSTNHWLHRTQRLRLPVATGVDDIALALAADAYSRTGRSRVYTVAASLDPLTTRHGLLLLPDLRADAAPVHGDRELVWQASIPPAHLLDRALADIASRYGRSTAYGVALDLEYPGFRR